MLLKLQAFLERFKGILKVPIPIIPIHKSPKLLKLNNTIEPASKFEFSKLIVIVLSSFSIIWINWYFILISCGMEVGEMGSVISEIVNKIINVILVYFLYQGWMKTSRNKYGLDTDGIPYSVKNSYNSIFEDSPTSEKEKNEGEMKDSDEVS